MQSKGREVLKVAVRAAWHIVPAAPSPFVMVEGQGKTSSVADCALAPCGTPGGMQLQEFAGDKPECVQVPFRGKRGP